MDGNHPFHGTTVIMHEESERERERGEEEVKEGGGMGCDTALVESNVVSEPPVSSLTGGSFVRCNHIAYDMFERGNAQERGVRGMPRTSLWCLMSNLQQQVWCSRFIASLIMAIVAPKGHNHLLNHKACTTSHTSHSGKMVNEDF